MRGRVYMMFMEGQNRFAIAARGEGVAWTLLAQFEVVVDFTVHDEGGAARPVHGLLA